MILMPTTLCMPCCMKPVSNAVANCCSISASESDLARFAVSKSQGILPGLFEVDSSPSTNALERYFRARELEKKITEWILESSSYCHKVESK